MTMSNFTRAKVGKGEIVCRIAQSRADRESAFRLVYSSYRRAGLCEKNGYEMRITPYHLLPTTETFVALAYGAETHGEIVSTISLVMDGELGLPMESIYSDEIAQRREAGIRIAEISCLADRRREFRRFLPAFLLLNRLLAQYARRRKCDQLLVAVHPKHARFYERYMGFVEIGGLKYCPHVRNHPAVGLAFDFERADRERFKYYDHLFGSPLAEQDLKPQPMAPSDVAYFGSMVEECFTRKSEAASIACA